MKLRLTILKEPAGFLGQNVLKATTILLYFFDILCFHWAFLFGFGFVGFSFKKGERGNASSGSDNSEEHL